MNKVEPAKEQETIKVICLVCRQNGKKKIFFYKEIPVNLVQKVLKELAQTK